MKVVLTMVVTAAVFMIFAGCSSVSGGRSYDVAMSGRPMRVAVLPFSNLSGFRDADRIIYGIYISELFAADKFIIEEPGNVRQFLIQERITSVGELEVDRLKILGKRLKADAVITGAVEEFDDGRGGVPVVSVTARMIESGTGRVIW
ncbi:MAG: hypothetical protein WA162_08535, partial [Thermodesulfobacteriota bacterium]